MGDPVPFLGLLAFFFLFAFGVQFSRIIIIDKGWGFGGDLLPSFLPWWLDLWLECVSSSDLAPSHRSLNLVSIYSTLYSLEL